MANETQAFWNPKRPKSNAFTISPYTNSSYVAPSGGQKLVGLPDNYSGNTDRMSNPDKQAEQKPMFSGAKSGIGSYLSTNGGKVAGLATGVANIGFSMGSDAQQYDAIYKSNPNDYVSKAQADPMANFQLNENPYASETGKVGTYTAKYAGMGASAGSAFGPVGTLIGGAAGAIGGLIGGAVREGDVQRKKREFEEQQNRAYQQYMARKDQTLQNQQRNQMNDYQATQYQNSYLNPYLV